MRRDAASGFAVNDDGVAMIGRFARLH